VDRRDKSFRTDLKMTASLRHNPNIASRPSNRVSVQKLSKAFRSKQSSVKVLDNLSIDVEDGEMLVLLGPSGCGKTTLLRCLVGLEQADSGHIQLSGSTVADPERGVFVPANRRGVGMVFQNYALWPHLTVARNVEFPLRARGQKAEIRAGRVNEVLEIVQCSHLADRHPPQLSGGQQQRVSLARALASRPDVLLLDEPLSNLDALLRIDLRAQLRQLHRSIGFTGIYVTHDQVEALNLATRIVVMRGGRIEQSGDPEAIFKRPVNEYVAEFLGARNRLSCDIAGDRRMKIGTHTVLLTGNGRSLGPHHIRTRPSDIAIRKETDEHAANDGRIWISGARIADRLPSGEHVDYIVQMGDETVFVEQRDESQPLVKGAPVEIGLDPLRILIYDQEGESTNYAGA
jgi:iron(III) transport system ATP-binding protein